MSMTKLMATYPRDQREVVTPEVDKEPLVSILGIWLPRVATEFEDESALVTGEASGGVAGSGDLRFGDREIFHAQRVVTCVKP